MPELPEVETVKRILEPQLHGRRITELTVNRPEVLAHPAADLFSDSVRSAVIKGMGRRGKYLLIYLSNDCTVIIHLRMTGRLLLTPADYAVEPHTHIIFHLDSNEELRYIDVRRFGRFWLAKPGEPDTSCGIHTLGIEAVDTGFTSAYLQEKLGNRRLSIKQGLLDQTIVAGLGNIYADEALFAAGIHPCRPAGQLQKQEWQALAEAIPQILEQAIINDEMTAGEYLAGGGKEYRNGAFFCVYGREGKECPRCKTWIERTRIAGRSSYYCPYCQPVGGQ